MSDDFNNEIDDFDFDEESSGNDLFAPVSNPNINESADSIQDKKEIVSEDFDYSSELPEEDKKQKENSISEEDSENELLTTANASLIGQGVLDWLTGNVSKKPEEIKKLGDDMGMKMNWYLALSAVSMLESIPSLIKNKRKLEKEIIKKSNEAYEQKDLLAYYRSISSEVNSILEYTRKFVKENKDYLTDNSDFFDRQLFEKIKAMNSEMVRDYLTFFSIIDRKGHNLLKEIIDKYND